MTLAQRLRVLVNQTADTPRLRSSQVLGHHAAGREKNWVLVVHVLSGRAIIASVECGFAVRKMKPAACEQSRRARMVGRGAGPENTHSLFNPRMRHAAVINRPALARRRHRAE